MRRNGKRAAVGAAAAALAWAAGGLAQAAPPAEVRQQREQAISGQSGEQGGTVRSVSEGRLVYQPYFAEAGTASVRLDPGTPVFQGDGRIGAKGLQPGVEVNVHYKVEKGEARAVAVDVLDERQAAAAKAAARKGGK